jgi:hypothetical protein
MILVLRTMEQILLACIKSRAMEHTAHTEKKEINAKTWSKNLRNGMGGGDTSQDIGKIIYKNVY